MPLERGHRNSNKPPAVLMSVHRKPPHGGKGRTARWHRRRAAKWAKRLALGDAAAAQHLAHRRLVLRSASLRPDLHAHMRMMRLARSIKRDEREYEKQRPYRLETKRMALINYARWGPRSSFRPGGECAYAGCDCEGSLPDHFVLCSVRGCHCSGKLHPLPDERKADATETALLRRLRRLGECAVLLRRYPTASPRAASRHGRLK
jgi:hypothetical protein